MRKRSCRTTHGEDEAQLVAGVLTERVPRVARANWNLVTPQPQLMAANSQVSAGSDGGGAVPCKRSASVVPKCGHKLTAKASRTGRRGRLRVAGPVSPAVASGILAGATWRLDRISTAAGASATHDDADKSPNLNFSSSRWRFRAEPSAARQRRELHYRTVPLSFFREKPNDYAETFRLEGGSIAA